MRKLAFVVAAAVVAGVATVMVWDSPSGAQQPPAAHVADSIAAPRLAAGDSAKLKGPRQPVFFRHDLHAGQYKMTCQYCHSSVAVSSEPGVPSMQTCMGCHLVIGGSDSASKAAIKQVRQAWADKKPIEWVRVHYLARHAHFPHSRHIKVMGPNACFTCHGDVTRMPQVFKVNNVNNMGWCINCHVERKVTRDCTACHY